MPLFAPLLFCHFLERCEDWAQGKRQTQEGIKNWIVVLLVVKGQLGTFEFCFHCISRVLFLLLCNSSVENKLYGISKKILYAKISL